MGNKRIVARLLTPVEAINFALMIDDHFEMRAFLESWQHGDQEEWNEDIVDFLAFKEFNREKADGQTGGTE